MKRIIKYLGLAILGLVIVGTIIFIAWAKSVYRADPDKLAIASDKSKNKYDITEKNDYWEIIPSASADQSITSKETGLIFYPGAKVEPQAYFYKLSPLANGEAGSIRVFVTKPALNLAIFNINQADQVIQDHPEIKNWSIGGHSLGGAMSCEYAKNHADRVSRLWLFGSYCGSDISGLKINVALIHGSLDGVLTPDKLAANRKNLPAAISDFEISGMNHAEIGNYGIQTGDNKASKDDAEVRQEMTKIYSQLLAE